MVIQKQIYTSDEFRAFCEQPENKNRLFELIDGEIVEKVGSFTPSKLAIRIARHVGNFADEHDIGNVTGADGTYILSPRHHFMPDVGYISKERLPNDPPREVQGPPDFAVEVKSPNDTKREMRKKAEDYLAFGTRLVWLVFPDDQEVEVYVPSEDVKTVKIDGVLSGGDVLPGFTLAVKDIFK